MSNGHDHLLQFFTYAHLPPHLQAVSKPFGDLARGMVDTLPSNPERSAGLRKLLEAKDCAVRALMFKKFPATFADGESIESAFERAAAEARERGETV
ncbi:MAG: hypothetical protein Q7T73_06810 [Beijerinckiaceae bacterium]|nr:hypothetical protein [Beijerinckiaceae bacterium]